MSEALVLVDGHVHFHDGFDADRFLSAAAGHFAAGARELGRSGPLPGCLAFTESAWEHHFCAFRDAPERLGLRSWRLERTEEPESLWARGGGDARLLLLAGRQIVTGERVEVLAIGTDREFPDGVSTRETLAAVRAAGALPVLPWGFGKWWFGRGEHVREIVESSGPEELYLGDNGGRLDLGPPPRLFAHARARGIAVLPGTDPLPFARENETAGSYGFALPGRLDPARPAAALKSLVRAHPGDPAVFGRRERLVGFCRNQLAMQLAKRRAA